MITGIAEESSPVDVSVRSFWARAGRPVRVLVLVLLACGVGYGWWTSRPFLTNLVSGLTSGCFGIPFALLIPSSLGA